jgi:hypothetical protein
MGGEKYYKRQGSNNDHMVNIAQHAIGSRTPLPGNTDYALAKLREQLPIFPDEVLQGAIHQAIHRRGFGDDPVQVVYGDGDPFVTRQPQLKLTPKLAK